MDNQIGLYIHIPFCKSKCHYCDFNSFSGKEALIGAYFDALKSEIRYQSDKLSDHEVRTLFIGGGTPSLAEPRHIYELLNTCMQSFHIDRNAEISIETNPGTLTYEKLTSYRVSGINRLSMGLQAFQARLLKELGRIHSREEFLENYQLAIKAGFRNINVDLIFGLPGQTLNDWSESVTHVAKLGVTHVSCYSLKIEEGTVFDERLRSGQLQPVEDELDRRMYRYAIDKLEEHGLRHYEISNFAKPGYECRHNLIYWKAEEYLGVGAGAHSYLEGIRSNNAYGIEEYIHAASCHENLRENLQTIDRIESMSEFMILGLRLIDGVGEAEFRSRYGEELQTVFGKQIARLLRKQLLEQDGDRIRLSPYGFDIANEVFTEFI